MTIISFQEVMSLIIMTFALGFIFSDILSRFRYKGEPLSFYNRKVIKDILFAAAIVAPAVILHEFGHKFIAMAFGASAVFYASLPGLAIGVLLRLIGFPFIIFVPGYVSIQGNLTALQGAAVAFAGPAVNLALGLIFMFLHKKNGKSIYHVASYMNLFLFAFNMLPIPPFDGFKVLSGLFAAI
ncbi:MAG: hypothetical protein PWR30_502 [Candidatus Woesearchaeota archaeon]|nr:hypothetical protein [Candidatus Woesearchaeota archaeon]